MQRFIDRLEETFLAVMLAFMTILTFVQVILRYVFNTGWVWSLEATTYSFAALVLIGMSYGVRTKTHITVDLLLRKIPPTKGRYVALTSVTCCLVYALMMAYGSGVFVQRLFDLGNLARDVPLPKWLLTATMPVGFLLLAYRFIEAGWQVLKVMDGGIDVVEHDEHETQGVIQEKSDSHNSTMR